MIGADEDVATIGPAIGVWPNVQVSEAAQICRLKLQQYP